MTTLKNLTMVENYENGTVTFGVYRVANVRDCFQEAIELLHNPEADKRAISSFLYKKTCQLLQENGIPVPALDFYSKLCEVHCVILQMCENKIDVMPKDNIASLMEKWDKITAAPASAN